MPDQYVTLRSGAKMPLIGFGTFQVNSADVLKSAIDAGYRMFDTASFYSNEWLVGDTLSRSNIPDFFVVSKAWNDIVFDGPAAMTYQIAKSIQDLKVDCIDLFMIHWPVPGKFCQVYRVLEDMHAKGKIRDIGLCNFTIEDYEELIASGIKILPSVIQLEINPSLFRARTISYFQAKGLHVMSYRGFGQQVCLTDPDILKISEKYKKFPAQILGRFLVQQGIIHIPKSADQEHMKINRDLFDFELEEQDVLVLKNKTTKESLEVFKDHYLSRRVLDTHLQYSLPSDVKFTVD